MERLKVGRTTLYRLVRNGELASIKIGSSTRFSLDAIGAFIAGQARTEGPTR
ncbi:MAG: Helix-turn-helix domain [Acidimicrobiaceae bacterium]|jgi:excisionase family DNA binding protein